MRITFVFSAFWYKLGPKTPGSIPYVSKSITHYRSNWLNYFFLELSKMAFHAMV